VAAAFLLIAVFVFVFVFALPASADSSAEWSSVPGPAAILAAVTPNIGHYVIQDEIARGGMGVVYRAWDPRRGATVALKLLLIGRGVGVQGRARFRREASALARLHHDNVVALHDVGEHPAGPYLVMDYVEGQDLAVRVRQAGPLPVPEALRVAAALARALGEAHERGMLHRDVKPSNVIQRRHDGAPLLTDFGLVRELDPSVTKLSITGTFLGTPEYWSPEQANGELDRLGPATDVYGLGGTLLSSSRDAPPRRASRYSSS